MNRFAVVMVLVGLAAFAHAQQNRLPLEEAQRYAKVCVEHARQLGDGPLKMAVDVDKPCAERGEGGGAMVVPDKNLTASAIQKAGDSIVPVGQLFLRNWTLVKNGNGLTKDELRGLVVN
ncbi:MAG: hypothetical protein AB7K24_34430, partial [Gemmataceae bacterium]